MDKKYSGLTKHKITLSPYSVYRLDFNDTKPNYFRVQNQSATTIYLGTSHTPTTTDYDFAAPPNGVKMYAEPYSRTSLYLYNSSGSPVTCVVLSFKADFDPLSLALSEINLDLSGASLETTNTVGSFSTSLPSGTNTLGNVGVTNTDYAKESKQYDYNTTLTAILAGVQACATPQSHVYFTSWEGSATLAGLTKTSDSGKLFTEISYISNDGSANITLTITGVITGTNTYSSVITLKPGEVIQNIKTLASAIRIQSTTVTPFRAGLCSEVRSV